MPLPPLNTLLVGRCKGSVGKVWIEVPGECGGCCGREVLGECGGGWEEVSGKCG